MAEPRTYHVATYREDPSTWAVYASDSEWAVSVHVERGVADKWAVRARAEDLRRTGK